MIPVLFIEEHNEAFLAWHRFVHEGYIPAQGNYLLHVDHHDDFEGGGYRFDPSGIPDDLKEIERITYEELGIADFIIPAVHKKLFTVVHTVKNLFPMPVLSRQLITVCRDHMELTAREYKPFLHQSLLESSGAEHTLFTKIENGLGENRLEVSLMPEGKYVLDLDLDYFCWDNSLSTRPHKRIEITKEAYEEFMTDRYHPFRTVPVRMLSAVEEDGHFYLEYEEKLRPDKEVTGERIEKRVKTLVDWLDGQEKKPAAIDVCSSRFSGYLPGYAWPYVKECFLRETGKRNWDLKDITPVQE